MKFAHQKNIELKQGERDRRVSDLASYNIAPTNEDKIILNTSVSKLVSKVQNHELSPRDVLKAVGRQALIAQKNFNPVTEIMIDEAEQNWATKSEGPLAGIPISLKDTFAINGYDSSLGYSKFCDKPFTEDAPIVKLIKDAGGYPYVKTNIPLTLLSFESYNDMWGVTENPHKKGYSSGGSSSGESALIAAGGSILGVGTDVAGSVRLPAHFCGIYSLRPTFNRFPKSGGNTSLPGQEAIPSVSGPMARSLEDLTYFFKVVIGMKPWEYDYGVMELEYREPQLREVLKFGLIKSDTIVEPSPPCSRALKLASDALKAQGHIVEEFHVPAPLEALSVGSQLISSDAFETCTDGLYWGENCDYGVDRALMWTRLPWFVRGIWAYIVEHWYKDPIWATLLRGLHLKTTKEHMRLVARREAYRALFYQTFKESACDFLLTVPNATPAFPHRGMFNSLGSCLYTFLFNIVDYPAGVLPVTKVNAKVDQLPSDFNLKKLNGVAQGAYMNYDADKMDGLPVGVQVVGRRFRDEEVLAAMAVVESSLHHAGTIYQQIEI